MTAATRIIVDQRNDVIRVPNQAMRYAPGGLAGASSSEPSRPTNGGGEPARLWLLPDGQPVSVSVTLGLDDDNVTEIVKGDLHPGDQLILAEERDAKGGQSGLPPPRF